MIPASELAELWRRHADGLELLARARCGVNEAGDCVQTAFIKLAQAEPVPDNCHTWLATVVRNEAISRIRARTRREQREWKAATERWSLFEAPPADAIVGHWTATQIAELNEAFKLLASEDQELVVARIWTGLGFREIASLTNKSRSQVHRQYHAALEQLRSQLIEQGKAFEDLFPCSETG